MRASNDNRAGQGMPLGIAPRGLSRTVAAAYIGISPSLFDDMVKDKRMPTPRLINTRTVWDRVELDQAFEELPKKADVNPFDLLEVGRGI